MSELYLKIVDDRLPQNKLFCYFNIKGKLNINKKAFLLLVLKKSTSYFYFILILL